jgi:hypothetical protein
MTTSEITEYDQLLRRQNLARWIPVLERWLDQYHGLEQYIPCESEHPSQLVLTALRELPDHTDDQLLAQRMARLDFLCWRARHADGERWQPLQESFRDFAARAPAICWQWDTERPEPPETEAWLLAQLRHNP